MDPEIDDVEFKRRMLDLGYPDNTFDIITKNGLGLKLLSKNLLSSSLSSFVSIMDPKVERKHGALFKCMQRRPDIGHIGHVYIFNCPKSRYHPNYNYPAVERREPNTPEILVMGFRFWEGKWDYYSQVPCLKALKNRTGHHLKIHHGLGTLSDLAYAQLIADNDFVVDKGHQFYHDMVAHVLKHMPRLLEDKAKARDRPGYLKEALAFYKELNSPDPLLELCFGITADSYSTFSPIEFLRNTVVIPGWVSLIHDLPECRNFAASVSLPPEYATAPLAFRIIAFWEKFRPIILQTHNSAAYVEMLSPARVTQIITQLCAMSRSERIAAGDYYNPQ